MSTLSYSGRLEVSTNSDGTIPTAEKDKLHTLLDDAIATYEGNTVRLETAVIHFERDGRDESMPRAHVEIAADGDISKLGEVENTIAATVAEIGLEASKADAKGAITVQ